MLQKMARLDFSNLKIVEFFLPDPKQNPTKLERRA